MHCGERDATDPLALRDKALGLRESVNASRVRLSAQREAIARLRAEIAALRELAAKVPAPAAAGGRAVAPQLVETRTVAKEAAPESARRAAPFPPARRAAFWNAVPYAAILLFAVVWSGGLPPLRRAPAPALTPPALEPSLAAVRAAPAPAAAADADDDEGGEALLLVHQWRLPGDETPLGERLGPALDPPGARPSWTAERTGERTYRVTYQSAEDAPSYDFDVDLDARRVEPTSETAALIAPRLVSRR